MARKKNEKHVEETEERGVDRWRSEQGGGSSPRSASGGASALPAILVTLAICVCAVLGATPLSEHITLGRDFQGGVALTFEASTDDASELSSAASVLKDRAVALGYDDATSRVDGEAIVVTLPADADVDTAKSSLAQTGSLEFVRLDEVGDAEALAQLNAGTTGVQLEEGTYEAFMDGTHVTDASVSDTGTGYYAVTITFDDEGAQIFEDVTGDVAESGGGIAIVVGGSIVSSASVTSAITGGQVSISGGFSEGEAEVLKSVIDSRDLTVSLTYAGEAASDPLVSQSVQDSSAIIMVAVWAVASVVLLVMWRGNGIVGALGLAAFGCATLGLLALCSYLGFFTLTVWGLLGIACGLAVEFFSLWSIIARMRSLMRDGTSARSSLVHVEKDGVSLALRCAVVGAAAAAVVALFPVAGLRSFAVCLSAGCLGSVLSTLGVVRPLVRQLARGGYVDSPSFWGVAPKTSDAE